MFPSNWGLGLAAAAVLVMAVALPVALRGSGRGEKSVGWGASSGENVDSPTEGGEVKEQVPASILPEVTIVMPNGREPIGGSKRHSRRAGPDARAVRCARAGRPAGCDSSGTGFPRRP